MFFPNDFLSLSKTIAHQHLDSASSTNTLLTDYAKQAFIQQFPSRTANEIIPPVGICPDNFSWQLPFVLTANNQTAGRGQHSRQWQSPKGNVYLSLYIPTAEFAEEKTPSLTQRLDGRLSLCVGYQLSQIPQIAKLKNIGVKWVNDIGFYTHNISDDSISSPQTEALTFNKLAGILIEPVTLDNTMLGVVIGVGMNIAYAPTLITQTQDGFNYQAVSLQDLMQENLQAKDFYPPISHAILQAIKQFNGFSEPSNVAEFLQDFQQNDILWGKNLQITLPGHDNIIGQACGIDSNGCLQILHNDGTITPIWTGTVRVL